MSETRTPAQVLAERRRAELDKVADSYQIEKNAAPQPPEVAKMPFENVTICCIYSQEDAHYLPDLLHSIAGLQGAKTIFGATKPGFDAMQVLSESETGKVVEITFQGDFDYGRAKNTLLGFVETEWVLFLDADERLVFTKKFLLDAINSGAGGVLCHVVSPVVCDGKLITAGTESDIKSPQNSPQIRLFKSLYRYTGNIHEQILPDIALMGHSVVNSPIVINHIGYADGVRNFTKAMRNLAGICKSLQQPEKLTETMFRYYLDRLFAEYKQVEFLKDGATKNPTWGE